MVNGDLWEELLDKLREMEKGDMYVQFWYIPKKRNITHYHAKLATSVGYIRPCDIHA